MKLYVLIFLLAYTLNIVANNTYYVDNYHGSDNHSGRSEKEAWKSLQKLNNTVFKPGDCILLKRGLVFEGSLLLKGNGTKTSVVKMGAYGRGERPLIKATGMEFGIKLLNSHHWEISDIETTGSEKAGIFVGCSRDSLVMDHIIISNCYVHDIGDTTKPGWDYSTTTGGIIVVNGNFNGEGKPVFFNSVFNEVMIIDCIIRYNMRWTCISISSGKMNGKGGNANIIKNCIAEFSVADGIRMNGVRNSRIEFCVMYKNGAWPKPAGRNLGGLGAWFFDAENCTIQYCEASYVGAKTSDGGAFDIDFWQKSSTVQYCYGHHCAGYGVSVFGADQAIPTERSVVRYNIFANNGRDSAFAFQGDFFVFTWQGGLLNGVSIHDNISYWNPASTAPALKFDAGFTGNNPNTFTGNIIYSVQPWLVSCKNDFLKCDSNRFWLNPDSQTRGEESPIWEQGKERYYSLKDWQHGAKQDLHSCYSDAMMKIPSWYGFENAATPFRKNVDGINALPVSQNFDHVADIFKLQKVVPNDSNGRMVLILFINLYRSTEINESQDIHAQLAFVKSMLRQYGDDIRLILVDESWHMNPVKTRRNDWVNFMKDHELTKIPCIVDNRKLNLAVKYGIAALPATFLLSDKGTVIRKWDRLALPAQVAFAIESEK